MTTTATEIEQVTLEDIKPDFDCSSTGCDNKARWMFIKQCCPDAMPMCDKCRNLILTVFERPFFKMFCRICGMKPVPREMLSWEKL